MAENNAGTEATPQTPVVAPANQGGSTSQASGSPSGTAQTQSHEKPLTTPLIKDPVEFLARARERLGFAPKAAGSAKPADPTKPDATAKPAEGAAGATSFTEAAKPADPAKPSDPVDDMAARVAKLSREQREFEQRQRAFAEQQAKDKAEREKTAQEHAAKLAQAETVEKAAKAIESGDVAGAIRMLKADVNPSAIALQLLEQLQREDERTMSPAEVERMIAERLKRESEARAKAEEDARKEAEEKQKAAGLATLETARENYMAACVGVFSKEKHPFIAANGLKREEVVAYAESQTDGAGRMVAPDPEELLNHFEEAYRKRAEAAGWAPKPKEQPKPAPPPSLSPSSLVQDQGSRLTTSAPAKGLEQRRAEIRQRLRIGGTLT